jgi:hypothetical protein
MYLFVEGYSLSFFNNKVSGKSTSFGFDKCAVGRTSTSPLFFPPFF